MSIRSEDENTSSMFHFTSKVRSMKHGIVTRKLHPLEKKYLLAAEHGDIPTVTRYAEGYASTADMTTPKVSG
ncbi:hypothetical protein V5799_018656 [Amblyomma americanum]|uniref:Uncharacterized protein n=1 Tax=Amblyomma americanum TaxID=6943 RepID=A0AAQ4EZ30_AMBAM